MQQVIFAIRTVEGILLAAVPGEREASKKAAMLGGVSEPTSWSGAQALAALRAVSPPATPRRKYGYAS